MARGWNQRTWWLGLPLVLLGCTVPLEEPPTTAPPGSEAPAEAIPPLEAVELLPPLSPPVLAQREAELANWIQSELDLAGLGKIGSVGQPISAELTAFRQAWAAANPEIAPYVGTWIRDWNLMPHDYMMVLPSTLPGVVCLVRYRQEETETVPFQVITTPLEFSVGQVRADQLLSNRTQTARSLIRFTPANPYVAYDIEFMGTVEPDGNLRLYAAQQPPAIDPNWDAQVVNQLKTHQCTEALPPAGE